MIPHLSGVPSFVLVAEQLSFREAARILGVTPTAVSRAVSRLEASLGVRLLHRTSRTVAVTPEGAVYLQHCREAFDRLRAGEDLVTRAAEVVSGPVTLSLPRVFGRRLVAALPRLLARHPAMQVRLQLTDRAARLLADDVDVAVRVGPLADSSLIARTLRSPSWVTVASPGWIDRYGSPATPDDLARATCVRFARPSGGIADWRFIGPHGAEQTLHGPSAVMVDDGELLVHAALTGVGVAQVFDFMVEDHLRAGALIELLVPFAAPGPPVHALTVQGRQDVPRVRAALDLLDETFGRSPRRER